MDLTKHIKDSIWSADIETSKLHPMILALDGMSSIKNRHLLNNILDIPDGNYLEIGVHKGSTFISALYKNKHNSAYAIDDWSQFDEDGIVKREFLKNCKYFDIRNYLLIEGDCFSVDKNKISYPINVYFYDGYHSIESTSKALTYFYDILDEEFIFIVDDYDWEEPHQGVLQGIAACDLTIEFEQHLKANCASDKDSWWNGVGILLLKKKE